MWRTRYLAQVVEIGTGISPIQTVAFANATVQSATHATSRLHDDTTTLTT